MTVKETVLLLSLFTFFFSCKEEHIVPDKATGPLAQFSINLDVRGVTGNTSTAVENEISTINVFSFSLKPGNEDYTYETRIEKVIPTVDGDNKKEVAIKVAGSLPRIFYVIGNDTEGIPFLSKLSGETSATAFEAMTMLLHPIIPQSPFSLVGKVKKHLSEESDNVSVELSHVVARLDIVNKYTGFSVDSLVLRNAVSGASLFGKTTPSASAVPRINLNYGNVNTIYLYQTDLSTLAVYGKYNGIRAVFDIELKQIKRATRYKVSFQSMNDSEVDFAGNLQVKVQAWNKGNEINSIPDWKH